MQEADASKDDELVAKVNRVMSGLPDEGGSAQGTDEMGESVPETEEDSAACCLKSH